MQCIECIFYIVCEFTVHESAYKYTVSTYDMHIGIDIDICMHPQLYAFMLFKLLPTFQALNYQLDDRRRVVDCV